MFLKGLILANFDLFKIVEISQKPFDVIVEPTSEAIIDLHDLR